ncbi:hypothetical protein BOTBODRAFT_55978 [Botryobasidium botryosum FD-172 SS1]|uniref:F-box domain-containing protein n=1 Tax=Botryobasidium botryosum (strain FD-172 SS1) TaxID=930990 RepID=A0A067MD12_BOTB1|nr:hypothetical protein BOTBODRAFT_55978 [Botryobasidium botryosum FD-172 SS1]
MDSIVSDVAPPLLQVLTDHICRSFSLHSAEGSVEEEMEAVELALRAFQACTMQTLARLRTRQNELVPVHRLPNELLGAIFVLAGSTSFQVSGWPASFSISQVCKLWRQVALNTPRLWMNIDVSAGDELASIYVERSGTAPLNLSVNFGVLPSQDDKTREIYWSRYADRWSRLSIQNPSPITTSQDCALRWLTHSAPILEALEISTQQRFGRQRSLDVSLDIQMPRLREVKLAGLYLPLTLPIFRGLTILHLTRIMYTFMTAISLLRVLVECPALEELRFDLLVIEGGSDRDEIPGNTMPEIVDLSHLRVITLRHLPVRTTQYLLVHIAIPPRAALEVLLDCLQPDEDLTHTLPPNLTHLSNLFSVTALEFFVTPSSGTRACFLRGRDAAGASLLSISVRKNNNNAPVQRIMASLGPSLSIMPLRAFVLHLYANGRWSASAFCRTLDYFPSIKALAFHECHQKFLKALAYSNGRAVCPSLEALMISDCAIPNHALAHLVWSRTAHNKDLGSGMVCLKSVHLYGPLYADNTAAALSPYAEASWDPEKLTELEE